MRILFILEPVIYRDNPSGLSAHFVWVDYFRKLVDRCGGVLAVAANPAVIRVWRRDFGDRPGSVEYYPIDPFKILAEFGGERAEYSKAAYGRRGGGECLIEQLEIITKQFIPDVVLMTAQNAVCRSAFPKTPVLSIEQAPLPRIGHPFRTSIDPIGHQIGSILEARAAEIRNLPIGKSARRQLRQLLAALKSHAVESSPRGAQALEALRSIKQGGSVALFVTQPTDGVTYEGAYEEIALENLIYRWAQALPEGWLGVPTYHAGQRLGPDMEAALAAACPRLGFLPEELSQGLTEPLLTEAEGMVTISSTAAMTGLLFGKRVIVTGRSHYNEWCPRDPEKIADACPLTPDEIDSTLCFLTNRFSFSHSYIYDDIEHLSQILTEAIADNGSGDRMLDISGWTFDQAEDLFSFPVAITGPERQRRQDVRRRLEDELSTLRAEIDSLRSEWGSAVAQRDSLAAELDRSKAWDQLNVELGGLMSRLEVEEGHNQRLRAALDSANRKGNLLEKASADAEVEHNQLVREHAAAIARIGEFEADAVGLVDQLARVRTERDQLERELRHTATHADAVRESWVSAVGARDQLRAELSAMVEQRRVLMNHLSDTIADRERVMANLSDLNARYDLTLKHLEQANARLDAFAEWADAVRSTIKDSKVWRLFLSTRWAGLHLKISTPPPGREVD